MRTAMIVSLRGLGALPSPKQSQAKPEIASPDVERPPRNDRIRNFEKAMTKTGQILVRHASFEHNQGLETLAIESPGKTLCIE
jgi:hypothetical protein